MYSSIATLNFANNTVSKISLYPNPANGKVAISLGNLGNGDAHYFIMSAEGKLVKSGVFGQGVSNTVQTLDISNIPAGSYFVKIAGDGITQKITKLVIE